MSQDDVERDKLIFDLIKGRYDSELEKIDSLDAKAGSLAGFVSILTGLIFGSGSFQLEIITSSYFLSIAYFLGSAFLLGSIICAMHAYKIRNFQIVPDVDRLLKKYVNRPYLDVLQITGATMKEAVEDIEGKNSNKADYINAAWYLLLFGLTVIFIYLLLYASGWVTTANVGR